MSQDSWAPGQSLPSPGGLEGPRQEAKQVLLVALPQRRGAGERPEHWPENPAAASPNWEPGPELQHPPLTGDKGHLCHHRLPLRTE